MLLHKLIPGVLLTLIWQGNATRSLQHLESLEYPDLARRARIQGQVTVAVQIASDGKVVSAVAKSGHTLLGREAEANVRKWVFKAGGEGTMNISYDFRLEKPQVQFPRTRVIFDLPGKVSVVSEFQAPDH